MLTLDLHNLSLDELAEASATLQRDARDAESHDPEHQHPELLQLFAALEHAVRAEAAERAADRSAEQHEIAEALAIDEETGEWSAGA
jgi:hypothetical protein